jgi:hypothetical protein
VRKADRSAALAEGAITRQRYLKEAELAKRLDFDRRRYRAAGNSIAA